MRETKSPKKEGEENLGNPEREGRSSPPAVLSLGELRKRGSLSQEGGKGDQEG